MRQGNILSWEFEVLSSQLMKFFILRMKNLPQLNTYPHFNYLIIIKENGDVPVLFINLFSRNKGETQTSKLLCCLKDDPPAQARQKGFPDGVREVQQDAIDGFPEKTQNSLKKSR